MCSWDLFHLKVALNIIKSFWILTTFVLIHNTGDCFNISAEQMFHGENNLSPEWHVDKFSWMGNRFLFLLASLSPAKLPKSAREILIGKFGRINLCVNLFLLGFINFQERKISLIISGKNFCQFSQLLLSFSSPEHSNVSPDP